MRLFNLITVAKVATTALDVSDQGFFLTIGAVRRGGKFYFVCQTSKWDDEIISSSIDKAFNKVKENPTIYTFPSNGSSLN